MSEKITKIKISVTGIYESVFIYSILISVHPLSTYVKFSEKLTFLTPWYAHLRVRIRGLEMLVFREILRTYLMDDPLVIIPIAIKMIILTVMYVTSYLLNMISKPAFSFILFISECQVWN